MNDFTTSDYDVKKVAILHLFDDDLLVAIAKANIKDAEIVVKCSKEFLTRTLKNH